MGHGEQGVEAGAGPLGRLRRLERVAAAVAGRHQPPLQRLRPALLPVPPAPALGPGPAPWPPALLYKRRRPVARPRASASQAAGSLPPLPCTAPGYGLEMVVEQYPSFTIAAVPQHPILLQLSLRGSRLTAL
jgi:hypothetical protein